MNAENAHRLPARVGVIGGGRMGAGIAHAFGVNGAQVVVLERDADAATAAQARVRQAVTRSAERGDVKDVDAVMDRTTTTTEHADLAGCDLVVEAVPEEFDLKVETLRAAEAVLEPSAFLATNTSSLSVDRLAGTLASPERFIGLHFFNPVPASRLIEIVVGERTDAALVDSARAWTEAMGKTPVVVTDSPGFASSRLGVAIALEAMRMVQEGVAEAKDIDAAMELGYKHPAGPLKTTDIVGLDVRLHIAEYLASQLGERFDPPQILRDKVAAGDLGRKTGKGFYQW